MASGDGIRSWKTFWADLFQLQREIMKQEYDKIWFMFVSKVADTNLTIPASGGRDRARGRDPIRQFIL